MWLYICSCMLCNKWIFHRLNTHALYLYLDHKEGNCRWLYNVYNVTFCHLYTNMDAVYAVSVCLMQFLIYMFGIHEIKTQRTCESMYCNACSLIYRTYLYWSIIQQNLSILWLKYVFINRGWLVQAQVFIELNEFPLVNLLRFNCVWS